MPDKRPFHMSTPPEIKEGEVTDVYFNRTVQILRARSNRARVKAEVYLKSLPGDWQWGILAGNTGFFKMDNVEVPASNLVGQPGEGFKIAMFAIDQGRLSVAAGATGLIRACRDASAKYARERRTFGVEIGEHQLVKEMIAQMESDYQAARLLWLRSGWMKNEGRRNTRETGLAKWFATVASERAASDAVQVHGANGYSDEYPVGRFYRNCKGAVIYEGTREIHKIMQADYLLGYRVDRPTRCELPAYAAKSEV